ncbi:hypothetical protein [Ochrobactrum sp. MYb379]|jgi:hypothetical protein|uniref:hypothetical protein n=1 Tax=Ochrobactrum sp. MYb379 TaxID=2745275 RepID=UPI0030AD8BD4
MDQPLFKSLCKAGKFKEALALAVNGHEDDKLAPTRFSLDRKTGLPIFYRGNKRVELDATDEWKLAKNTNF